MQTAGVAWVSAGEVVDRVRSGALASESVVATYLERIDRFDERVHAYVYERWRIRSARDRVASTAAEVA